MDPVQAVRDTWAALLRGDPRPLEAIMTDAKWRAVEDGPWNCENRDMITKRLRQSLAEELCGTIEEAFGVGTGVVVRFRPAHREVDGWPLDQGHRYMVITMSDDRIVELKGCRHREDAVSYAGARGSRVGAGAGAESEPSAV
jgi:ketosteroid isomerase-like protein